MTDHDSHPLELACDEAWPANQWCDVHVVLAVSGGPDSVALLRAALAIKGRAGGRGRLHAAHLNHGARPDADADQQWLQTLCERFGVPLEAARADVTDVAADAGDGWEAAARSVRYDFLRQTAERLGARFVAVAHTADDQVETVLHHVLRGTGMAGLAGMPQTRPLTATVSLVRPLLGVGRSDVLDYLAALGQDYRSDAMNKDLRFTRNRLRHRLLPFVRSEISADADRALLRLAEQARQWQSAIACLADELVDRCTSWEPRHPGDATCAAKVRGVRIDVEPLTDQPAILVAEVCKAAWTRAGWPLQAMGFGQWQQLAALATGPEAGTPLNLPGGIRAHRSGGMLRLELGTARS